MLANSFHTTLSHHAELALTHTDTLSTSLINVMAAYRDYMRKGREERDIRRSWEDNPNDKVSIYSAYAFARYL